MRENMHADLYKIYKDKEKRASNEIRGSEIKIERLIQMKTEKRVERKGKRNVAVLLFKNQI